MSEKRVKFIIQYAREDITVNCDWDQSSFDKLTKAFVSRSHRAIELNNMVINMDHIVCIEIEEDKQ
jgi:hypothetical protein